MQRVCSAVAMILLSVSSGCSSFSPSHGFHALGKANSKTGSAFACSKAC